METDSIMPCDVAPITGFKGEWLIYRIAEKSSEEKEFDQRMTMRYLAWSMLQSDGIEHDAETELELRNDQLQCGAD